MRFNTKEAIDFIRNRKEVIKNGITRKLDLFSPEVRMLAKRCILTGGATASIFHSDTPNDWDLLFLFDKDVQSILINPSIIPTNDIADMKEYSSDLRTEKVIGKCITTWAITCKNGVQFILRNAEHRKHFDFIHCMPYYDITRNKLFISGDQFHSIMEKNIILNPERVDRDKAPNEKRLQKYIDRGWTYNPPSEIDKLKAHRKKVEDFFKESK